LIATPALLSRFRSVLLRPLFEQLSNTGSTYCTFQWNLYVPALAKVTGSWAAPLQGPEVGPPSAMVRAPPGKLVAVVRTTWYWPSRTFSTSLSTGPRVGTLASPAVGSADALKSTVSPGCTPTVVPPRMLSFVATPERDSWALTVAPDAFAGAMARMPVAATAMPRPTAPAIQRRPNPLAGRCS